jgi:hypothetical protein
LAEFGDIPIILGFSELVYSIIEPFKEVLEGVFFKNNTLLLALMEFIPPVGIER